MCCNWVLRGRSHACVCEQWNATDAVLEGGFTIVEGRGKYLSDCYNNCNARFGVGNAMSTSPDGSVTVINR